MCSVRRLSLLCRPWLLPLLLPLLLTSLVSCSQCEAISPPPVTPLLWVTGGQVYLYSYGASTLYVLRESDGKQLWQAGGSLEATTTDQLYLRVDQSSAQGIQSFLEARQQSSGKLLWRTQRGYGFLVVGTSAHSVLLYDDASGASELVSLDASTGAKRWNTPITTPPVSAQVEDGIVFLISPTGRMSAYNEESGALLWEHTFLSGVSTLLPWFVSHGAIYLSRDHLYALRESDGVTLWQTDPASIALDPNHGILYTLDNHHLSALHAQDGQVLWTQEIVPDTSLLPRVQLIDGTLYTGIASLSYTPPGVPESDFLNGVTARQTSDGHSLWDDMVHTGNLVTVTGAAGNFYLLSHALQPQQSATLTARRASDGALLWQQRLASAAGLVYADGTLYIGYAGDNQTSGCTATGLATVADVRPTDGKQLWSFHA